ncbi:MAG TPA: polysaccharide biosynthesis protein [Candidatus Dorea intestinavium]|nr:polysaccharide biosynthesis protein [Candidatus Dorea intestinavium]
MKEKLKNLNIFGKKTPTINKILFILTDIVAINISSFLGLYLRFNLKMSDMPIEYVESVKDMILINTIVTIIIFAAFRLYTTLWRFASLNELANVLGACFLSVVANVVFYLFSYHPIYRSYFIIYGASLFLITCFTRFSYRIIRLTYRKRLHGPKVRNTMIIGGGEACNMIMKELELSGYLDSIIRCIIDDDKLKHGNYIHGVKVVGGRDKIIESVKEYGIDEIIIAIPSASRTTISEIVAICQKTDCELKILPGVYQLVNGEVSYSQIRNVEIEDLLGRDPVNVLTEKVGHYVADKVVLITGGGGTIGSELCRQVAANGARQIIIFDIYENNAYEIQQEMKIKHPEVNLVVLIGSVRNRRKLEVVFSEYRPDIVFHAAAHKHVPLMEDSPGEAVKNNVFGTYKTALMADKYGVDRFVLISTDKAVNPTNIMGATKRICEMIIQTFNDHSKTDYVAVRFGNVLGSSGSVVPLFKKQIEEGGPVTVTHPDVIRYFMTIPEAVSLVLQAGASAKGGEIFVLDMGEPAKIDDLAKNLIRLSGYTPGVDMEIKYTGLRPGEKLYEEMLMEEEGLESTDNNKIFIGKPIEFCEKDFLEELENLYKDAYAEKTNIKAIVSKMVPTYHIKEVDKKRDAKILEELNKDFVDTSTELPLDIFKK